MRIAKTTGIMVRRAKPTMSISLKRSMTILFILTSAVPIILILEYIRPSESSHSQIPIQTHLTLASAARSDREIPTHRYNSRDSSQIANATGSTSNLLPLWRDDASSNTVVPTGAHDYHEGLCETTLGCTVYFPHVDLATIIQHEQQHKLDSSFKQNYTNPGGKRIHTLNEIPKLLTNYSQYPNSVTLLTRRGNKGHHAPNQDRIVMLQQGQTKIIALFDGHGPSGHVVAHSAALDMLKRLSQHKSISKSTLSSTFLQLDKALTMVPSSGCTSIVMIQQSSTQVLVANLGDSQALIAEYNATTRKVTIVHQTQTHKPHMPTERHRIEAAGGRVILPVEPGDSSRVIIPIHGGVEMALAMSRCFGDHEGKYSNMLTAEPTVDDILLEPDRLYFAVAATDGLFDFINAEDVARYIGEAMFGSSRRHRLMDTCEQLVFRSSNMWDRKFNVQYRDDISIMVSRL